jgi:hypothetical protein
MRLTYIGVVLSLLAAALAGGSASAQRPAVTAQLDRYSRGEFAAVAAELAALDDFGDLLDALKRQGPAWIDAGPPERRDRRRLSAATFALEAARAAAHTDWKEVRRVVIQPPPPGFGMAPAKPLVQPDSLTWKPPPLLVEWGCTLMRDAGPPTPIERIWHLAAIAVAQRWGDYEFLIDSPEPRGNRQDEIDHLVHVAKRFPNEARIVLAQAIAIEWRVWALRGPRSNVAEGISAFERLTSDPAVGAEATMRLGSLRLRSRNPGGAAELFDQVETLTRDRYLTYLARYFRGQAREQQKRLADAERDYRGALATVPHATSATMALAALLARGDRRAEASALVEASLTARPPAVDPWRGYGAADDRFWPELIARLRAEITK